jgi:hypothetical protein
MKRKRCNWLDFLKQVQDGFSPSTAISAINYSLKSFFYLFPERRQKEQEYLYSLGVYSDLPETKDVSSSASTDSNGKALNTDLVLATNDVATRGAAGGNGGGAGGSAILVDEAAAIAAGAILDPHATLPYLRQRWVNKK